MKQIKHFLAIIAIVLLTGLAGSCNAWLDVDPEDRIMERALLKDEEGFISALNGVYSSLNEPMLYGRLLSMAYIDVMAQFYNAAGINEHNNNLFDYDQSGDTFKSRSNLIWSRMYYLIANVNLILENIDNADIPEKSKHLIKGEALALRAFMHFDLLRIYGEIYKNDADKTCIPYSTASDKEMRPLLSSKEIAEKVAEDAREAVKLLEPHDNIIQEGALNTTFRCFRMNYFAAQALLARVSLWTGNKEEALRYATEIIRKCQQKDPVLFPFATTAQFLQPGYPDRLFSTEVLFALYNLARGDAYKQLFAPELSATTRLSFQGTLSDGRINEFYDDKNDLRYLLWTEDVVQGAPRLSFRKFEQIEQSSENPIPNHHQYMFPLIRLSEMYLIAAECEPNLEKAVAYVNTVRNHRRCLSVNATQRDELDKIIAAEMRRETIGEGQTFFFYKRNAMENIPNAVMAAGNINMRLSSYTFPLPDAEEKIRIKK